MQTEPVQVLENSLAKFRSAAVAIEILYAQNERAVARAAAFLRAPESERVAGVQVTGRRRRKAAAIGNLQISVCPIRFSI